MRRRWRVLAGIGAFLWIPVMVLVFVALGSVDQDAEEIPPVATIATLLFIPAWVAAFAAIVLMVRHVYTETNLSIGWKTAWTALLFLLNVLVAPIYFLRHMATSSAPAESPGRDPTAAGSRSSTDR